MSVTAPSLQPAMADPAADLRRRPRRGGAARGRPVTATCGCRCGSRPTGWPSARRSWPSWPSARAGPPRDRPAHRRPHRRRPRPGARRGRAAHPRPVPHGAGEDRALDPAGQRRRGRRAARGLQPRRGCEEFLLMPLGREPLTQYERLAEVRAALRIGVGRPRGHPRRPAVERRDHLPLRRLGVPRGVRAPLHLPRRRAPQQPPLRPPPRAARPGHGPPLDLRRAVGRQRAPRRRARRRAACAPGDVVVFELFNGAEFVLRVARRPAPGRDRGADQLPPLRRARSPTCSTTAARRAFVYDAALAQTAADALARAAHTPRLTAVVGDGDRASAHRRSRAHRRRDRPGPPRRRHHLRRDDPPVHVGHHRDAQGRLAERRSSTCSPPTT